MKYIREIYLAYLVFVLQVWILLRALILTLHLIMETKRWFSYDRNKPYTTMCLPVMEMNLIKHHVS